MVERNGVYPYNGKPQEKTEGQKFVEAAIFGLALGAAIGAIALYLSKKEE